MTQRGTKASEMSDPRLEVLRATIEAQQAARVRREFTNVQPPSVVVKPGRRWTRVDVGESGKYMVDSDDSIYGIKAYGVPHFGHQYGTLETIGEWDWSDYSAVRKTSPPTGKPEPVRCLTCGKVFPERKAVKAADVARA